MPFYDHSLHYYHAHKNAKLILDINVHVNMYTYETFKYIYIYIPPQDLLFAPFCLPNVLPESFCTIKKKTKKQQKQTKKQKNKKKKKKHLKKNKKYKTLREMPQPEFPQSLCFFCFFRFAIASDTFLKKTLSIIYRPLVLSISLKKRCFAKKIRQFILNFFL